MSEQAVCATSKIPVGGKEFFVVGKESIVVYHLADRFYLPATRDYTFT